MRNFYQKKCAIQSAAKTFQILFTFIAMLIPALINCNPADASTWSYKYYTPDNAPVEFNDVISVSGGGQLAIGKAWDSGTSDTAYNPLIVRFDQNGQVLWSKNFTFPGRWFDDLRSVVESSDGGFIATGKVLLEGTDIYGNAGLVSAVLILKVDAKGNLLWNKLFNNHGNRNTSGNRVKTTIDGNYVIVGEKTVYFRHDTGVYSAVATGALITKIDTNGNILFSHAYYGDWTHSLNWSFNDVVQDSEGSYYAVGFAGSEAYSEAIGGGGMLLAKIDSSGSLVWAKKYDTAQDSEGVYVNDFGKRILLSDNTLYVAGITYTLNISSFSLSGVRNWTKQYSCVRIYDTGISAANDFIHSGDGNFFVTTGGGCKSITKINPSGAVLWSKNTSIFWPTSLTLEADKSLILGGWVDGWSEHARAGTVSKYDSNGKSCDDKGDIIFTVADIEMLTNAIPNEAVSLLPGLDEISAFSGPALTVEKICEDSDKLYYPHVASNEKWETEICAVNTSSESISGSFQAYDNDGDPVSNPIKATLVAHARKEMMVGDDFDDPSEIGYVIFESDSQNVVGYTKFYQAGLYRVAVPAVQEVNTDEIYIPHIASNSSWWTGLALLNTTDSQKNLIITFSTGITKQIDMAPGEHTSFNIKSLFGGVPQSDIKSAVINGGAGVIGLELFSKGKTLSGVLLKDDSAKILYFPHVASNNKWWTGIAAYNPNSTIATMKVTPYTISGSAMNSIGVGIPAGEKYLGSAKTLSLPETTAWFKIDSDQPLNGFELFGSNNGNILAGYSVVNINRKEGVFPKLDTDGWTGIAFVNTTASKANISLSLYDDDGYKISEKSVQLAGYEKIADSPENIFGGSITAATYMKFSSDNDVVGFQLNGSSDDLMLDALPGM